MRFTALGLLFSVAASNIRGPDPNIDWAALGANAEYQTGRAAFEKGDFDDAMPHFLKAAELAPHFPEPHFALSQILVRIGRHAEAQARMALAQERMAQAHSRGKMDPGSVAAAAAMRGLNDRGKMDPAAIAAAAAAGPAGGSSSLPIRQLAAQTAAELPASHAAIGHALTRIAQLLSEAHDSIVRMAASTEPQDIHNAKIHAGQFAAAETLFASIARGAPTDANLWWQLALNSFNLRRDYATAAIAFGITAALSTAQMVVMSYYLLYHAWQHLCDWRDWEARLRVLADHLHQSLGDGQVEDPAVGSALAFPIVSGSISRNSSSSSSSGGGSSSSGGGSSSSSSSSSSVECPTLGCRVTLGRR